MYNDWLADCTSWEPTLPYLDTDTFTYVLTDLRGYGRSMELTGEYNEIEAAADTLELANHLRWDRFHLVGYSMTGMVVERLAIDAPDRIKSIVAIGPVSAAGIKMSEADRQFFVDVITDDDKARELADRVTGHQLSRNGKTLSFVWHARPARRRPPGVTWICGRSMTSRTRREKATFLS